MNVSGKIVCDKIHKLRPELSSIVTPKILDEICEEPLIQPFLNWFCENVNHNNVLSDEEIQIMYSLQNANQWLKGDELDRALDEAAKDLPVLLKTVSFDDIDINDFYAEFEIIKDSVKEDENYIYILQNGIQNLRKLEWQLDEDIEKEKELLDKECIKADKAYKNCSGILREFNTNNHEFFKEVEHLFNTYADAVENKGVPLLWTQMPLDLFIKKIELYSYYLGVQIRQQFESVVKEEQKTDSNCISFIDDSKENRLDAEKLKELTLYTANLNTAKIEEVLAKIQEEANIAMLNYVQDIYNLGNLKVPKYSDLHIEISELTRKRDFMEVAVSVLQEQLTELVHQFAELEISKILKQNAHTRLEQKKDRLEMLKNLRFLAQERGHVRADLLCILMQIQFSRIKDVSEFVTDVRHYLTTEYLLSSMRCESMQQQQHEYSSTTKTYNSFNKHFVSMVCSGDNTAHLNSALDKYNEFIDEIKYRKQLILEKYLNSKIQKLKALENNVNVQYVSEIQKGPTHVFKPNFYEIETCYGEAHDNLQRSEANVSRIRSQMKERMKSDMDFEREKNILWQRFLVDPDTLKRSHEGVKQMANKSCFGNVFSME